MDGNGRNQLVAWTRRWRRTGHAALLGISGLAALAATAAESAAPARGFVSHAEVIAVSPRRTPGGGASWRGRVMVELDTGTRHLLIMTRPLPRVGDWLPVEIIADSDGGAPLVRALR